jgi:hypothetical protein
MFQLRVNNALTNSARVSENLVLGFGDFLRVEDAAVSVEFLIMSLILQYGREFESI